MAIMQLMTTLWLSRGLRMLFDEDVETIPMEGRIAM